MSNVRLVVGICTGGTIRAETLVSLITNIYNLGAEGIQASLLVQIGGYVDVNRNKIVESAVNGGATHLMFIDNDMIFPDDAIFKLLKHNKDIVGANYNVRLDPTSSDRSGPTVKMLVKGKPVSATELPDKLFKCYALGTGFLMIKTKVFSKMKAPHFEAFIDKTGRHNTEDVEFCKRAGKAGFKVWCDPEIKMGHIGSAVY